MSGEPGDSHLGQSDLLDQVIAEYLARADTGRAPDRGEFLSRYPDLADGLRKYFADQDAFELHAPRKPRADPFPVPHVLGQVELRSVLGRGSFGTVYKGWDAGLVRWVAVKALRLPAGSPPEAVDRAFREARVAAQLSHPGVVRALSLGESAGVPYVVSEYVAGRTLADRIADDRPTAGEAAGMVAAIADALHHAHDRAVVHRDVKPANILLEDGRTPRLTDFGLALWHTGDETHTADGRVVGTVAYMSPEQARGRERVDARSDVYSLGVVLYELLTGERPFVGTVQGVLYQIQYDEPRPPKRLDDRVPRDLDTVCLRCLQKDADRRYATAAEVADDLRRFLAGVPVRARPVGRAERLARWARRNPGLAVAATLVALLVVATVGLSVGWAVDSAHKVKTVRDALFEARRVTAVGHLDRGVAEAERGDVGAGLHWMARSVAVAPDGAGGLVWTARANLDGWRRQVFPLTDCTPAPPGRVHAFAPDGTKAWVVDPNPRLVRCWDRLAGRFVAPDLNHPSLVTAAAVSRDGARVASGCATGTPTVRVWDARTGVGTPPFEVDGEVRGIAFLPDGNHLVVATLEPRPEGVKTDRVRVRVWDAVGRRPRDDGFVHPGFVEALAVDPDGTSVFVVDRLGTVLVEYDLDWGRRAGDALRLPTAVTAVAVSPDGQFLLTAGADGASRVWDRAARRLEAVLWHREAATAVGFDPGGRTLLTASPNDAVRVWAAWGAGAAEVVEVGTPVETMAFNPPGGVLATGSDDRVVRLWRNRAGRLEPYREFPRLPNPIRSVGFSPDGRCVGASSHIKGGMRVWDVETGNELAGLPGPGLVFAFAFSPDGEKVAAGLGRGAVVWNVRAKNGDEPLSLPHPGPVRSVTFRPGGKAIVTGGADGNVRAWDSETAAACDAPVPHGGKVRAVAFSPDGETMLAVAGAVAHLWRAGGRTALSTQLEHNADIPVAAFAPNGRVVVTGSDDHTARLWDVETGRSRGLPLRHAGAVTAVAFAPTGDWTATGSADRAGHLWGAELGRALGPPLRHREEVRCVAIDPAGPWVLTGGLDKTVRRWPAPSPAAGSPEQLAAWAEVVTGTKLDAVGAVRTLTPDDWRDARVRLQELGGPPSR